MPTSLAVSYMPTAALVSWLKEAVMYLEDGLEGTRFQRRQIVGDCINACEELLQRESQLSLLPSDGERPQQLHRIPRRSA